MTLNEYRTAVDKILAAVPRRALLELLAEESVELAQAALKEIRAEGNGNPTPVTKAQADADLKEQACDVLLVLHLLEIDTWNERLTETKMRRWLDRLGIE